MSQVQQYWLPGYGLSRHIVLGHIQYFLGPTASVRPYSYQEQIDDLATMSREYERQESLRMAGDSASPTAAATFGRHEPYINEIVPVRSSGRRSRAPPPPLSSSSSSTSQMMDYEPRRSR
ncbi:transcription factor RfeG [Aspergillus luchuensis]|uniref:Transcription factor RfeG n=1 Tax=Aspergillus kawachii TaxID=1069201 RepID=A0A146FD78_ASPKA|nr:transcription factor RfeG [Aspergillus luchuensis]